jgi:16S rRNA (guanine966-N2)-methyltransferase
VRESLFNIVTARLDLTGLSVLDLYAGSGALGLEALSRGAGSVLFVESDRRAAAVLERNIATVGLPGASLRRGQVATVIAAGAGAPVDLVLADPPYEVDSSEVESLITALAVNDWVGNGGVVVVERPAHGRALSWPDGWDSWQTRTYGDTRLELAECR